MEPLVAIAVGLAIATLVGHGIWVTLAWLLRAVTGGSRRTARCPVCRAVLASSPYACESCHWSALMAPDEGPLRISLRMLQRAERRELIDHEVLRRASQALRDLVGPSLRPDSPPRMTSQPTADAGDTERAIPRSSSEVISHVELPEVADSSATVASPHRTAADQAPGGQGVESVRAEAAERVRRFADRQVAPLAETADKPVRVERKPWTEWLSAFMHEKNIRWGEVVGGLLIVSSSIALVVSFWEHIAARPLLKFGVFTGVTASLFGLGLHVSHRWKLPNTSQGVLMIAMMLVPLNFLALASFAEASELTTATMVGEFVTLGVFLALGYYASRLLVPQFAWLTNLLVVAPAFYNLAIRRFVFAGSAWPSVYAVALPLVAAYLCCLWPIRRADASLASDDQGAVETFTNQVWKLLGLASFAFALAVGFLAVRTERLGGAVQRLAPVILLSATPSVLIGTRFWKTAITRNLRTLLVPACGVALGGVVVMLAGVVLAWPIPWLLIVTTITAALTCLVFAIFHRAPEIHLAVVGPLSVAFVLAGLVVSGNLDLHETNGQVVLARILTVDTGFWLTGYGAALLAVAITLHGLAQKALARHYGMASLAAAVVGGALITAFGFGHREHVVSVCLAYAAYAILFGLVARYEKNSAWQWASGIAIAGAGFQAIYFGLSADAVPLQRLCMTLLAASTMYVGIASGQQIVNPRELKVGQLTLRWPFEILALVGCGLTTIVACGAFATVSPRPKAWIWGAIAALWLILAWRYTERGMFAIAQGAALACTVLTIDDYAGTTSWYATERPGWQHPFSLQLQATGWALFGGVWLGVRGLIRWWSGDEDLADTRPETTSTSASDTPGDQRTHDSSWQRARWLTQAFPCTVDQLAVIAAVALLFSMSIYAAAPGVLQELMPAGKTARNLRPLPALEADSVGAVQASKSRVVVDPAGFELDGLPHLPMGSASQWWLVALVVVVTSGSVWERASNSRLAVLVTALASIVYLLAMRWEPLVSVASALRWNLGGFFLIGNGLLWLVRSPLTSEQRKSLFELFCLHAFVPLAAMLGCVATMALWLQPLGPVDQRLLFWLFVVGVVSLALMIGERRATQFNWLREDLAARRQTFTVSTAVLACMPMLAVALYLVGVILAAHPVTGPDPASFFARIGLATSYSIPVLLLAMGLIGTALAFRSSTLALWAGIFLNVAGTAAYLLTMRAAGFRIEKWLQLAEINAVISALFALGWLSIIARRRAVHEGELRQPAGWQTQTILSCGFLAVSIVGVLIVLWWNPRVSIPLVDAAIPWGWLSVISVATACWFAARFVAGVPFERHLPGVGITISVLMGCHLQDRLSGAWDTSYLEMGLVTLCGAVAVARMIQLRYRWMRALCASGDPPDVQPAWLTVTSATRGWVVVIIWVLTLFAFRFLDDASARPWPTTTTLLAAAVLAGGVGWIEMRWRLLWCSAALINLAGTITWMYVRSRWLALRSSPLSDLLYVNVLAAALPTVVWVPIFRHWTWRSDAVGAPPRAAVIHRFAVPVAVLLASLMAAVWLVSSLAGGRGFPNAALVTASILGIGLACWACCWDGQMRWQSLGLYVTGLCGAVALLQVLKLSREPLFWSAPLVFGAYGLAASYVISRSVEIRATCSQLHLLPVSEEAMGAATPSGQSRPTITASCLVSGVTVALAFLAQFGCNDQAFRVAAAQSILAQALALALLTRCCGGTGAGKQHGISAAGLRLGALSLGVLAVVASGWSNFDPAQRLVYERTTVIAVACSLMALAYGVALVRLLPERSPWIDSARQLMPALIFTSAVIVCSALALEIISYLRFETEVPLFAIVGITATLAITLLACLMAALIPGRDPLGLSDQLRVVYVYAAQVALLLIVVHLRISLPWLFGGIVQQMWPLLVMLLAFAEIGFSEWVRRFSSVQPASGSDRSRFRVLIGPLEQVGALLPLLPALGYWMLDASVHYSLVMIVVGLLYGVLAQLRGSFGFSVLAAIAANGSLWYLLHDNAIRLFAHPQVWLIPPALCVLVAAQLNKRRLTAEHLLAIRYACATVIYVSSTAEIFITGVAQAPWLPLVLAGLSLAGIAVGIAARIRSFLWLGLSFLTLSMLTIIWYAAVDLQQTWLWYVAGIVAGFLILAVFAVFEKRRADVLRWAEALKQWE